MIKRCKAVLHVSIPFKFHFQCRIRRFGTIPPQHYGVWSLIRLPINTKLKFGKELHELHGEIVSRCLYSQIGRHNQVNYSEFLSKLSSDKTAIVENDFSISFKDLLSESQSIAKSVSEIISDLPTGSDPVCQRTVAFLTTSGLVTSASLFASWMCGCTAVPISPDQPYEVWDCILRDCRPSIAFHFLDRHDNNNHDSFVRLCLDMDVPLHRIDLTKSSQCDAEYTGSLRVSKNSTALILHTRGTMGPPKGVVITHGALLAHISAFTKAFRIDRNVSLLNLLPMSGTYGLISGILSALSSGSTVHLLPCSISPAIIWESLVSYNNSQGFPSILIGTPAVFQNLLTYYQATYSSKTAKNFILTICRERIRLMISCSAALPNSTAKAWEQATGHKLIECYGMAETGIVIAASLKDSIQQGCIGNPLPKTEVCIAKPNKYARLGYNVISNGSKSFETPLLKPIMESEMGELYVRGPSIFHSYWGRKEETASAFTRDGWFKTGDVAQYSNGSYRILGRASVDIIKSGGFQISALDVERHLSCHEDINECVVLGTVDIVWGEKVAAVVVLKPNCELSLDSLRDWCKTKMPAYCVPTVVKFVSEIPRNHLGEVNKKQMMNLFQ